MKREGVAFAGNLVVDYIKYIDSYPELSRLSSITSMAESVGGLACNCSIAFSRLCEGQIPIELYGAIGDDDGGEKIKKVLQNEKIGTEKLTVKQGIPTSFTDVFTLTTTGERTFFHNRGANAAFSPKDIDLERVKAKILHIGYVLLLDQFDEPDEEYGTVMARFLAKARQEGIKTSLDVVSEQSTRFASVLLPALPHSDYIIINEIEAGMAAGQSARGADDKLDTAAIESICLRFIELGVKELVVIHAPEGSFCMELDKKMHFCPAANLKSDMISGKVGAGDAFAAGMLLALYEGATGEEAMVLSNAAAAQSLRGGNVLMGLRSKDEALALYEALKGI